MTDEPRRNEYLVPPDARRIRCRSCGAEMIYIVTPLGRRLPLSAATIRTDAGGRSYALAHFADCPDAEHFRKPKPRRDR